MKNKIYDQSNFLITRAAHLYFKEEMHQSIIAKELNVSPATVSRLIKAAKENNVVNIIINPVYSRCMELREILMDKYGLSEVIIAPVEGEKDPEEIKKMTAVEGARYIQRIITNKDILGIAWGGTMSYVINYLNPCQRAHAQFVTLHGGIYSIDYELDVHTLVSKIASAFSGRKLSMMINGLVSSPEAAKLLLRERNIWEVYKMYQNITISLSGVGSLYPQVDSPLGKPSYITEEELKELQQKNVYGDLVLRYFDADGQECDTLLKDRTMAIDFDTYRNIPNKIVVASGTFKYHTVKAALKGKLIDTLVTDYFLAEELAVN